MAVSREPLAEKPVEPKELSVWPMEPRPRRTVMEPGVPAWAPGMSWASWMKLRTVQGDGDDLLRVDDRADGGVFGLENGGGGGNVDGFGDGADFNLDVDTGGNTDLECEVGDAAGLETFLISFDGIVAGGKEGEGIAARFVRGGFANGVGLGRGGLDADVGNGCAGWIGDDSGQGRGSLLGGGSGSQANRGATRTSW